MFRAVCIELVEGSCGGTETTTVPEPVFVVSLTDFAVTVTVSLPDGSETAAGAI